MKQLEIGVRVRYIGWQAEYNNAVLYLLIWRTGVITARSTVPGMDWFVEMDEGCYDIDVEANTLEPIDDGQEDKWTADEYEKKMLKRLETDWVLYWTSISRDDTRTLKRLVKKGERCLASRR